jgi:hypothetical protein
MLLFDGVWHDNQEEVEVFGLLWRLELSSLGVFAANVGAVVVIDCIFECLDSGFVAELYDITVININVESSLL